MGSEQPKEMLFWTKEEYLKFIDAMMDKPMLYYAFEILYWCGIREGELLAQYRMKLNTSYIYRVYHYDFKGFYFA